MHSTVMKLQRELVKANERAEELEDQLVKLREQKPVAWMYVDGFGTYFTDDWNEVLVARDVLAITPLYAAPVHSAPSKDSGV